MQMVALPILLAALLSLAGWAALVQESEFQALVTLVAGGIISLLLCALQWRHISKYSQQNYQHQQYLKALERLSEIAAAISARIDSPEEVLKYLASPRDLLSMDRSAVALLDKKQEGIRLVRFRGTCPKMPAPRFELLELPLCRNRLGIRPAAIHRRRSARRVGNESGNHGCV